MLKPGSLDLSPDPTTAAKAVKLPEAGDATNEAALAAREILLEHYTDPNLCSTTALAERLGVTASHLCHVYRSTWGATIGNDLRRLRVDLAKRLLADRTLPIKQVAARVGYERATYRAFFNAFRAETGMPPSRYRRLALRSRRAEEYRSRRPVTATRAI